MSQQGWGPANNPGGERARNTESDGIRRSLAPGREGRRDEKDRERWRMSTLPFTPSDPDHHLPVYLPAPPLLHPFCHLSSCPSYISSSPLPSSLSLLASPSSSSSFSYSLCTSPQLSPLLITISLPGFFTNLLFQIGLFIIFFHPYAKLSRRTDIFN